MLSAFSRAFAETFRNLRNNFFQTFLSVLGIIIGVGALVAMLAMIDGLEYWAQDQIASQSSMENMIVEPNTGTRIDGIYTERDTIAELSPAVMQELLDSLPYPAAGQLLYRNTTIGYSPDSAKLGIRYQAVTLPLLEPFPDSLMVAGQLFATEDAKAGKRLAVVNTTLARRLLPDGDTTLASTVGRNIYLFGDSLSVVGVFDDGQSQNLSLLLPLATMPLLKDAPTAYATLNVALEKVENVLDAEKFTQGWMTRHFPDIPDAVETITQTNYLEQMSQGLLVFRLVMGFLIGIAVVVGGVGVMNVLLMSIAERTPEIGVRKAVGANRGNIVTQFLSESVAISAIGCFFGVILGMTIALIAAPIMNYFVDELEFQAVFSFNTLVIVLVVALVIGVLFGTYPARKAARLDPVEAIRR